MKPTHITVKNLCYQYPNGTAALNKLTLTFHLQKKTAILGANGCGKSTLLYHLNGLYSPTSGDIFIDDTPLTPKNTEQMRQQIGFLFDNPDNQIFSPTVETDVSFGLLNLRLDKPTIEKQVDKAMGQVRISELKDRSPFTLSLGQKKRCAIAGVLAMNPQIILMDEPFSGLDPLSLTELFSILDQFYQDGVSIIMSTHDVDKAYEWADEVVIMKQGNLLAQGDKSLLCDAQLMANAGLTLPTIAKIFEGFSPMPRSIMEARAYLQQLEQE